MEVAFKKPTKINKIKASQVFIVKLFSTFFWVVGEIYYIEKTHIKAFSSSFAWLGIATFDKAVCISFEFHSTPACKVFILTLTGNSHKILVLS